MAGVVFAKLARAKCRTNTVVFSKYVVVGILHTKMMLMFQICCDHHEEWRSVPGVPCWEHEKLSSAGGSCTGSAGSEGRAYVALGSLFVLR